MRYPWLYLASILFVSCSVSPAGNPEWHVKQGRVPVRIIDEVCCTDGWQLKSVAWSEQGRSLSWLVNRDGRSRVTILSVGDMQRVDLEYAFDLSGHDFQAGQLVLWGLDILNDDGSVNLNGGGSLILVDPGDEESVKRQSVAQLGGLPLSAVLSPDGQRVAYVLTRMDFSSSSLVVQDTKPPFRKMEIAQGDYQVPRWGESGSSLVLLVREPLGLIDGLLGRSPQLDLAYVHLDKPTRVRHFASTRLHTQDYWMLSAPSPRVLYRRYADEDYANSQVWQYSVDDGKTNMLLDLKRVFGTDHTIVDMYVCSTGGGRMCLVVSTADRARDGVWLASLQSRALQCLDLNEPVQRALISPNCDFIAIFTESGRIGLARIPSVAEGMVQNGKF